MIGAAQTGVIGEPSLSPDYPKSASVFYSFVVDSSGDGRFSPDDDAYTLVLQRGIRLTRTEHVDRTVYELTTELTSPDAELIREADKRFPGAPSANGNAPQMTEGPREAP